MILCIREPKRRRPLPILTSKHCRQTPDAEDGTRILVMRYWPRGVPRTRFHIWMRQLAPSVALLKAFKDLASKRPLFAPDGYRTPEWLALMDCYRAEIRRQKPELLDLGRRHLEGETLTLLCGCHDPDRCHRTVLASLILDEAGARPTGRLAHKAPQ